MSSILIPESSFQTVQSVENGIATVRSTDANSTSNSGLISDFQTVDSIPSIEVSSSFFDPDNLPKITSLSSLLQYLGELMVRFDTVPKYYNKGDYEHLVKTITNALIYLYDEGSSGGTGTQTEYPINFIGVATLTTNPAQDRIDLGFKYKGVYLLQEVGEYTNFGLTTTTSDLTNNLVYAVPSIVDGSFVEYKKILYNLTTTGGSGSSVFESDILVNLSDNKTLGVYSSGQTIPSSGKTFEEVMRMIAIEAIAPSATLSISGSIPYNQSSISLNLVHTFTLNTPGVSISSALLQTRRGGTGTWTTISTDTSSNATFTYNLIGITDKVSSYDFQYIVTDSNNQSVTKTASISPVAYSAPTTTVSTGNPTRELGNISTSFSGSVSQLAQTGVSISSVMLQYSINNSTWFDISSVGTTINYIHNDSSLINATILYYRLKVDVSIDGVSNITYLNVGTVSFAYKNVFGYLSTTTPTLTQLLGMDISSITNSKSKTVTANAGSGLYTYYAYNYSAGDLSGIIMDGVTPVLGAFTKLSDISGTNSYGASVTYRVYKSNAPQAFTNNSLVIS